MFPQVTLPNTEIRAVHSTIVNQTYELLIALPPSYGETGRRFPVCYMLDAYREAFAAVKGMAERFARAKSFPELLLVGITYPTTNMETIAQLRIRDFTPTVDSGVLQRIAESQPEVVANPPLGGAAAFLRCLREEIMPFIAENYRADVRDNTLSSFSFGGLFALYALFHAPATFQRYIIGSPSIWWDDGVAYSYESTYAAHHADLDAHVFLSVGALEDARYLEHVPKLGEILRARNYPNLDLHTYIFDREDHASVAPATVVRGLRKVYSTKS